MPVSPPAPTSPARLGGPRLRRAGWAVGLAGFTVVVCAACLADQGAGEAKGPMNQGTTTSASADPSTTPSQAAELFTTCMRANGQPDFPGITISPGGSIELDSGGAAVDPLSSAYRTAFDACDHYLPKNTHPTPSPAPPQRPLPSPPAITSPAPPTLSPNSPSAPVPVPSRPPATPTPPPAPPKPSPSTPRAIRG
jgi:hypothetical protein